jgi:hypothetical protein
VGCLLLAGPSALAAQETPPAPAADVTVKVLPEWLQLRGEFRGRLEGARHAGFSTTREDLYWLNRFRVGATVTPIPLLALHAELQDARVARKDLGPTGAPFAATLDVRQAHTSLGTDDSTLAARIGRQELAFGEQRLVGHVSWLNAARTFDAARVTVRRPGVVIDAFASSVVRILTDELDRSGQGNQFHGVYAATSRLVPRASVEPYLFWRRDRTTAAEVGPAGPLTLVTTGVRTAGRLGGGLTYAAEIAVQRGTAGGDDIRAWAGHARLETAARSGLAWLAEYNYASGDANPADGRRGTFDPLYPTPHDKYGLADQIGWRNMHHARVGLSVTRWPALPVRTSYHHWWLAEGRDGAYTPGGAVLARVPTGASSRHIGQEIDVQVARAIGPRLQVAAGYALILPGAFLRQTSPGARAHFPFAMLTFVFLDAR